MAAKNISLEGIPEPMARAIEFMVETARNVATTSSQPKPSRVELPVWNLGVKKTLRREDFYGDAG